MPVKDACHDCSTARVMYYTVTQLDYYISNHKTYCTIEYPIYWIQMGLSSLAPSIGRIASESDVLSSFKEL